MPRLCIRCAYTVHPLCVGATEELELPCSPLAKVTISGLCPRYKHMVSDTDNFFSSK